LQNPVDRAQFFGEELVAFMLIFFVCYICCTNVPFFHFVDEMVNTKAMKAQAKANEERRAKAKAAVKVGEQNLNAPIDAKENVGSSNQADVVTSKPDSIVAIFSQSSPLVVIEQKSVVDDGKKLADQEDLKKRKNKNPIPEGDPKSKKSKHDQGPVNKPERLILGGNNKNPPAETSFQFPTHHNIVAKTRVQKVMGSQVAQPNPLPFDCQLTVPYPIRNFLIPPPNTLFNPPEIQFCPWKVNFGT
jgi:hypothetical protein